MKRKPAHRWILVIFSLMLTSAACKWQPILAPHSRLREPPGVVPGNGNVVHIRIPCATLTPYQDYRDFMTPGSSIDGLRGHPVPGYPTQPPGVNETIIPPAEATLVFDHSEGCQ